MLVSVIAGVVVVVVVVATFVEGVCVCECYCCGVSKLLLSFRSVGFYACVCSLSVCCLPLDLSSSSYVVRLS